MLASRVRQLMARWRDAQEPIPVLPTVHYNMGGIPTNLRGQVCAFPLPSREDVRRTLAWP